jgi:flagellar biosynthesis chaperone FliJ
MSYDRESFIQSFVSFLPKNINELESRLNQMREDMEQAVQALIQNQNGTQPTYIEQLYEKGRNCARCKGFKVVVER